MMVLYILLTFGGVIVTIACAILVLDRALRGLWFAALMNAALGAVVAFAFVPAMIIQVGNAYAETAKGKN